MKISGVIFVFVVLWQTSDCQTRILCQDLLDGNELEDGHRIQLIVHDIDDCAEPDFMVGFRMSAAPLVRSKKTVRLQHIQDSDLLKFVVQWYSGFPGTGGSFKAYLPYSDMQAYKLHFYTEGLIGPGEDDLFYVDDTEECFPPGRTYEFDYQSD